MNCGVRESSGLVVRGLLKLSPQLILGCHMGWCLLHTVGDAVKIKFHRCSLSYAVENYQQRLAHI